MGLFGELKHGWRAANNPEPGRFALQGKTITCPHCSHDRFRPGKALLSARALTFWGLDWANREATTLRCEQCGRIEWFGLEPQRVS